MLLHKHSLWSSFFTIIRQIKLYFFKTQQPYIKTHHGGPLGKWNISASPCGNPWGDNMEGESVMLKSESKSNNNETKFIKIKVNIDQYYKIKQKANDYNLTLQDYLVLKGTDDTKGVEEIRNSIVKLLPDYYNRIRGVGNTELQQYFTEFGGIICQL